MILTIWLYDHHHYKNITSYLYGLFYSWLSMIFVLAIFYIKVFIFFNNKVSYVTTMFVCLFEFFKNSDWLMNSWKPIQKKKILNFITFIEKIRKLIFFCVCVCFWDDIIIIIIIWIVHSDVQERRETKQTRKKLNQISLTNKKQNHQSFQLNSRCFFSG